MKIFTSSLFHISAISILALFSSCSSDKNNSNYSSSIASNATHAAITNEDMKFLLEAQNISIYNTYVAREGLVRSTAVETSAMAQEMLSSGERMIDAISKVATRYTLTLPTDITDAQKSTWRNLVKQKGWNFDKTFSVISKENAEKSEGVFTQAIATCKDETVKKIAQQGLAELKIRQDLLLAQQEKIKERVGDTDGTLLSDKLTTSLALEKQKK